MNSSLLFFIFKKYSSSQEKSLTDAVNECSSKSETSVNDGKSSEYDVAINYSAQDSEKVNEVVMELEMFFERRKIAVYTDRGSERELSIRPGRWQLFVLSPQTVNQPNTLIHRCACVLEQGLRQNAVHVLPVLVDIEPKDLPRYIKWVTVVNASETSYCEKLFMTMKGKDIDTNFLIFTSLACERMSNLLSY